MQVIMNKTLRYILNAQFDNNYRPLMRTNAMYKQLNLLKLNEIYEYFMIKFIHSCIYGNNYNIFEEHFSDLLPHHTYQMRESKMNLPVIRLQLEKFMTKYNFIRLINKLPEEFLIPQSSQRLKFNYKKHALQKY